MDPAAAILLQSYLDSLPECLDAVKLKLTVAYDAHYKGGGESVTVQQRVEEALRRLFPSVGRIQLKPYGHRGALQGMVAHVEIPAEEFRVEERKIRLALNAFLPDDVSVMEVKRVPMTFRTV